MIVMRIIAISMMLMMNSMMMVLIHMKCLLVVHILPSDQYHMILLSFFFLCRLERPISRRTMTKPRQQLAKVNRYAVSLQGHKQELETEVKRLNEVNQTLAG